MATESQYPSNFLPVALKEGVWDCEVIRDWSAATNEKELQKGEVSLLHPQDDRLMVAVRTPKGKPATYRIQFFAKKPDGTE